MQPAQDKIIVCTVHYSISIYPQNNEWFCPDKYKGQVHLRYLACTRFLTFWGFGKVVINELHEVK
jgi:hypothetical protein